MRKIKVLVVDDSLIFREVLARGISSDPYIEVVAKAVDPFDARDKILEYSPDYVGQGSVLIAPGGQHMRLKKVGERYRVECFEGEKVNGHCPSIDILFESMAKEVGDRGIGIMLTGMGYDGAKGLLTMRRKGARTLGQDEKSSVVYGMPKVAFEIGAVERQIPLGAMAQALVTLFRTENG